MARKDKNELVQLKKRDLKIDIQATATEVEDLSLEIYTGVTGKVETVADRANSNRRTLGEIVRDRDWIKTSFEKAKAGGSLQEIFVAIGVSKSTMKYLAGRDTEVAELIEYWELLAEAKMHEEGRINLSNREFSYAGYKTMMENRFGWGSKVDIAVGESNSEVNLPVIEWVTTVDAEVVEVKEIGDGSK